MQVNKHENILKLISHQRNVKLKPQYYYILNKAATEKMQSNWN